MFEWSEEHQMIREAMKDFIAKEIVPIRDELEHGDTPPYEVLRKLYSTFGIGEQPEASFRKRIEFDKQVAAGEADATDRPSRHSGGDAGFSLIPTIELCRQCPGLVTALGVSVGLTASAINGKGTIAQRERWVPDLLTLRTIGAWAITEPNSGSDAFGSMLATARRDGDEYVLNGNKTFITNGPYADTIVFICKLDEGNDPQDRKILSFVLDAGMPGLTQTKPLRKMGMHSSPTGELFLDDVRVGHDRLIGEDENPTTGGGQPIGQFQLIQQKLAMMEVARMNIQNLVWRTIEMSNAGQTMTFAEASAMKLYAAQQATACALEAVQLHGGNGYMAEYHVEQLARDAKVLQIYAGTDEIQTRAIARSLLSD